jgi:hypothetical protein
MLRMHAARTAAEQEATRPARPGLDPIRLVLADRLLDGWTRTDGQRMTDLLQRGDPIPFLPADARGEAWTEFLPYDVLLLVPPPHVSAPEVRVHRQRHEVMVRVGEWVVSGTAHLRPGEGTDYYLRATRPYLPLTDAMFAGPNDGYPHEVETVIVNLVRVEEFREV